ncbi:MAG: 30S ribosomal protein S15 [Patescibacteria group bacterium]
MALTTTEKQEVIKNIGAKPESTGSTDVQIALLTAKIHQLNDHLKKHLHDFSSKRGLLKNVGQRRRLLRYLSKQDPKQYELVLKKLNLRK